ncbi:MAG: transporter [Planctomycetaceae bacterium]|nr:transporter [Planctomycetaceae bacterium]
MRRIRQIKTQRHTRYGAVTVEFALVVPLVFLFFFAQLEFARANMIRHAIKTACYEGARAGIVPGATADEVREAAQKILNATTISTSEITVTPSLITTETTSVTVSIAIPVDQNSWVVPQYFKGRSFSNSLTLDREKMDLVVF